MKHAPGPWTATQHGDDWQIDAEHHAVATTVFCFADGKDANAKLIAAAPDLLAALRYFLADERFQVAVGGNPIAVDRMLDEARAALAKAEGQP